MDLKPNNPLIRINNYFLFGQWISIKKIALIKKKRLKLFEDKNKYKRISVDLPENLIKKFDRLRKEWGLRSRGNVIQKLIEEILLEENSFEKNIQQTIDFDSIDEADKCYELNAESSIVLIKSPNESQKNNFKQIEPKLISKIDNETTKTMIDLPSFLNKKVKDLKSNLNKKIDRDRINIIECNSIKEADILNSKNEVIRYWDSLYGTPPNKYILDLSMEWLRDDIWNNVEVTDDLPFSWSSVNVIMSELCSFWISREPTLDQVIIIAGVLEDPYGTSDLIKRIPTIIRRFTSRIKKGYHFNSFQVLASTMTVVGALKLLNLSTSAGSSHTLNKIRDAYRSKALETHPDSGGSSEQMRKVNEAYQLLKNLYKSNSK